ncbi:hypothetical protein Dda_4879 [Drechslerella dactyloides]|uniref:Uncharacterized protein n=1 Tax=Drechslerella dactyloides TaxID=74499 RepID=A0AAD6J246_DREDA|nr:hypothetical protein Dda_4879 [Drechslerella dactyloides]
MNVYGRKQTSVSADADRVDGADGSGKTKDGTDRWRQWGKERLIDVKLHNVQTVRKKPTSDGDDVPSWRADVRTAAGGGRLMEDV